MNANVIDTLRYADRLKEAGVEAGQAEAMSRALNAELTQGLATKPDLDKTAQELGARIDELGQRLDARIDLVEQKLCGRIDALASQFATQNRYVFLTLTLIAGLGLYNAIAPRFAEKASAPTPPAPQPVAERNASDD